MTQKGHVGDEKIPFGQSAAHLPTLALSSPRNTLARAEQLLATDDPEQRSYARQATGIALRELGDVRAGIRHLKAALVDAAAVGPARQADVAASLAVTLVVAGRSTEALELLDSALEKVTGVDAARIRVRRGSLLGELGRPIDAARELRLAIRTLRRAGDTTWESGAQLNLAMASIEVGDTVRADAALVRVEVLLSGDEQTFEAALSRQYRGFVAVLEGRIADALGHYDVAAQRYAVAGTLPAELFWSRAEALLAAGMAVDALRSAEDSVELLRRPGASAAYRANALVRAAAAALAAHQPGLARRYGEAALRLYRRQGHERGATLARLSVARSRVASGERSGRLMRELARVADDARQHRLIEVSEANLLTGEVALAVGDTAMATLHLARARRARNGRSDLGKVTGWRAAALSARAAHRPAAVLAACGSGLGVLEDHQATLGAIETRAAATTHGLPLAKIAIAAAVEGGDARLMLRWVERWRSTTLRLPAVRLPDDPQLASDLAQLRLARLRLSQGEADNRLAAKLEREVGALETAVRDRTRRTSTVASATNETFDVDRALDDLAGTTLVEIFLVDDVVHVLVASDAGVRHQVAGSFSDAQRAVDFARFSLRRMTHRAFADRARASLPAQAAALQRAVFGAADGLGDGLGDGPLVIVPPASLSSAPWGVLPALRERPVYVAASAASWWSARQARPATDRVALVAGPALHQAPAEVEQLAAMYPSAQVLPAGSASTDAVLRALDGAALAHVAAHGTFRADNPLFSALLLDDGPLTVYDLQRLERAPHRLVLSCCDSGTVSAAGADEVLGLASALVPLGMAGMIAAAVPVSDEAAVPFAVQLHEQLRAGASSAEALRDARLTADQPASYAIAHSFIAFGAA